MRNTCQRPKCNKTFGTEKQLRIHEYQHTQENNTITQMYTLDEEGIIDRRKMIYQGTPMQEETQVHDLIKYTPDTKLWNSMKCGKTETAQDKGNTIQHVLKAHPRKNTLIQKIPKLNLEERTLDKIRIRTLGAQDTAPEEQNTQVRENTPPTKTHKYAQTPEMKQYNRTFRQRIELIKENEDKMGWQCLIGDCKQTRRTIPIITQHISRQHSQQSLREKQQVSCPFCKKRYTTLIPLLTHLHLNARKQHWNACQCPLQPQHLTQPQIWHYIQKHNNPDPHNPESTQHIPTENRTKEQRGLKHPKTRKADKNTPTLRTHTATNHTTLWEQLRYAQKETEGKWTCAIQRCRKTFATNTTPTKHIYTKHAQQIPPNPRQTQECPNCGKEEMNIMDLAAHIGIMTKNRIRECIYKETHGKQQTWNKLLSRHKKNKCTETKTTTHHPHIAPEPTIDTNNAQAKRKK